ncbi:APC family permease [Acidithiobacillus sp. IBUN Pt1247-S3]|uniref:APC family permease n=1 Tax=Acidithiobacillus sp. IBUN Pt1247-S3 TaxID=3166642 RepID=UPI0034E51B76
MTEVTRPAILRRELTKLDLIIIGVSGAVGTGVLFGTAGMAALAGPGVICAWLLGGLMYLTVGLTYIDLNALYPEEGGPSRYSLYTYGPVTNMINALCDLLWYLFIPPIEALGAVTGLNSFYPHLVNSSGDPTFLGSLAGIVLMIVFFPFNYFGIKTLSHSTNFLGVIKLALYTFVALGFVSLGHWVNFHGMGGFLPYGIGGIIAAVPLGMYAFGSLRVLPDFTEEVHDARVIPSAILWSLLGQTVLYALFGVALVAGLQWSGVHILPGNWSSLAKLQGNPFVLLASTSGREWLLGFVLVIAIIGPFVTGYIYQGAGSRIVFAMARSRIFNRRLLEISKNHGIPAISLLLTMIVGVIIAFIAAPLPSIYNLLGDAVVAGYLGFAVNPPIMIALRIQGKSGCFTSKFLSTIVAGLAFISASLIVYWSGWPDVPYSASLVLMLASLIFFMGRVKRGLKNAIWYIGYILFLTLMAYIGSEGALQVVNFYWGSVLVALVSVLVFLPWGVGSRQEVSEQVPFIPGQ